MASERPAVEERKEFWRKALAERDRILSDDEADEWRPCPQCGETLGDEAVEGFCSEECVEKQHWREIEQEGEV